jgi:predicted nucleic acid-binding protein
LAAVTALPAHVMLEAFSVLTRLPGGLALEPEPAAELLRRRFDGPSLVVGVEERAKLLDRLAAAGVFGGAAFDGLIALEAAAHGETLLTLDERAQATYRRLGVAHKAI